MAKTIDKTKTIAKLEKLYRRTINNCAYYSNKGDDAGLLNEIGCLRGIAYCLEELGCYIADVDQVFVMFIGKQQELKGFANK